MQITVNNFQSIKSASLLVKGFTVVTGQNNSGKALRNGTVVCTPTGGTPVEALSVGDRVIAGDGTQTVVGGVYPQGVRSVWRVLFDDGRSVDVDSDHLWEVSFGCGRFPTGGLPQQWQTLTTAQIMAAVGENPKGIWRPAVPIAGEVEYSYKSIPLDPYLLGVLLGDGCLKGTPRLSSVDQGILREVEKVLPQGLHLVRVGASDNYRLSGQGGRNHSNFITQTCRSWGLDVLSDKKFIPKEYKRNTPEVRRALLQGLMDTDGHVSKGGSQVFYTVSPRLADDVAELVWSLGGKVRRRLKSPTYKYKGETRQGQLCFVLTIQIQCPLFRLPRKQDRVKKACRRLNPLMVSFEPLGQFPCTCIKVSHPSRLFQVCGHIVTHNSALIRSFRGATQNTKGTAFVRHGTPKSVVKIDFDDGHTLEWSKGTAKADKPTYIVDGGSPIYPGQAVPDEVKELGVVPITAGGKEVWPQIAPQFSGQVFLLNQPGSGSILAEAVADVERVGQLNRSLKLAESDRRSAASELKVRKGDLVDLENRLISFGGLAEVEKKLEGIGETRKVAETIQRAIVGLSGLQERHTKAVATVESLSGIEEVGVPDEGAFKEVHEMLAEVAHLRDLKKKHTRLEKKVTVLQGVELVEVVISFEGIERYMKGLGVMEDMLDRYNKASEKVAQLEKTLVTAEKAFEDAKEEFTTTLGGLDACPTCGSATGGCCE